MRALTVWEPWASLIIAGHKPVENRTWPTKYRGALIIHAGRQIDRSPKARELATQYRVDERTGVFLGVVDLHDVHQEPDTDWCNCPQQWAERGVWHWCVSDPQPFAEPIPGVGRQQLFTAPEPVMFAADQLLAEWGKA